MEKVLILINKYLDQNKQHIYSNRKKILLNNILKLIIDNEIVTDFDSFNYLLSNSLNFNCLIDAVLGKNTKTISSCELESISSDNKIIYCLKIICLVKKIEIIYQEESIYSDRINEENFDILYAYLNDIVNIRTLTFEEQEILFEKIAAGDKEAKNKFIEHNLKLVVYFAKRYSSLGLTFLDLIQEGNLGLMRSVDLYDIKSGYKFSTFAAHRIKGFMLRAICEKGNLIRIPDYLFWENRRCQKELLKDEENLAKKEYNKHPEIFKIVSLNDPIGEYSNFKLEDCIFDKMTMTLEEKTEQELLKEDVETIINKCNFSERDKNILMLAFGLNGQQPLMHKEIGEIYNITSQRVSFIIKTMLKKMRTLKVTERYSIYMDKPVEALRNLKSLRYKK